MSRYPTFDVAKLRLRPLQDRVHDLSGDFLLPLRVPQEEPSTGLREAAVALHVARAAKAASCFLLGGHVLRSGVQRYLFSMMEQGFVQGVAVNGAVAIHDYEIALQCATTESVARYIREGRFGLWEETGRINGILREGAADGLGFGESLGRELAEGDYPHKDKSLFARAWRLGIPVTVHVGIGYDIIHAHPDFDGGVTGAASHRDFLIFARLLDNLEQGCVCTFGSAVMAPEVFLKALSMVRNVALQEGRRIEHFTSLVCDVQQLPNDVASEADKADPRYYFRPWKTLLSRTVAGGGKSIYVQGMHQKTIPLLWKALKERQTDE